MNVLENQQELSRRHLLDFTSLTKPDYKTNWHHKLICQKLEDWYGGKISRLMIFTPPQEGKSELVSRRLPAWILGKNPEAKIVSASYAADLATSFSKDVQRIMTDESYSGIFPATKLATPRDDYIKQADNFEIVKHGGSYKAVGVGGALSGRPADFGIIDDPIKDAMEAYSETMRDRVWEWYINVFCTRLHNDSRILLTMTRWHENDLAGRILNSEGDKWEVIRLPAIKERMDDPNDPRQIGDALWPERHSLDFLNEVKVRSHRTWISLYQQEPAPDEGNIINRHWFKYFNLEDLPTDIVRNFRSDTAYGKETSDNSATICYSINKNDLYIWNVWKANLTFPDFIRSYKDFISLNKYTPQSRCYFEPKATGMSVIQQLKYEQVNGRGLNVIEGDSPSDAKETRADAASSTIEAGRVFLLANQGWIGEFVDECAVFPNGVHDDQVDVLTAIVNEELNGQHFGFVV